MNGRPLFIEFFVCPYFNEDVYLLISQDKRRYLRLIKRDRQCLRAYHGGVGVSRQMKSYGTYCPNLKIKNLKTKSEDEFKKKEKIKF